MENKLNDISYIKNTDKSNMAAHITNLPKQIQETLKKAEEVNLPQKYHTFDNVCIVGMGGSGSAADILFNQKLSDIKKPLALVREMNLPGWVDDNTLVILLSHSGQTKETLESFKDAAARESKIIIIAERGKLEEMGEVEGATIYDYDTDATPRASLGYQLGFLIYLNNELQLTEQIEIEPALQKMFSLNEELKLESPVEENLAKHLAFTSFDHESIILASGILKSVARRFKNQLSENAKTFSCFDVLPEAMHNSIEGTSFPSRGRDDNMYFLLRNDFDEPYISSRFDVWASMLDEKNIQYEIVQAQGDDTWTQKLSTVLLVDWTSYYLAILNNMDPTPVPTITKCKEKLDG